MALRDYYSILFLLLWTVSSSFSQETEVRCINPKFDELVDDYLEYAIPTISVADAYVTKEEYIFLDARELEEYSTSHIEKAIHIGYDDFKIQTFKSNLPKDTKIIVYCSIGYRSEKIGKILQDNGYQNVYNLYGSIFEWVNQHRPIYDQNGNPTKKLHTYNKKWSKWVDDGEIKKVW